MDLLQIPDDWRAQLEDELRQPYMGGLVAFLKDRQAQGAAICPKPANWFRAFSACRFDEVKVVLLGQDPYHRPGQAMGLSFSVPDGVLPPPSLRNIFKELQADLQVAPPTHGDLTSWAAQGVLLLNTILTVEAHRPLSHQNRGWERFTDAVIRKLSEKKKGLICLHWGRSAQQKEGLIDTTKHYLLHAAHPSPFSANRGFLGSRPFSRTNALLVKEGKRPVRWKIK